MISGYVHDGRTFIWPHQLEGNQVEGYIREWAKSIFPEAKKINEDHFIYATKIYDKDYDLREVHLYMTPLSDDEFYRRTSNAMAQKDTMIYSWHKGSSY